MAFSITDSPDPIAPLYNPMFFRTQSDLYTAPDYKYIFTVYKDADAVATIKVLPDPSGYGLCDVAKILRSYVSAQLQPTTPLPTSSAGIVRYKVAYGEEAAGGIVTAVSNQATGIRLTLEGVSESGLTGKLVQTLILNGLILSSAGPYYILHVSGNSYGLYTDALLTSPVTATGTFSANGFIQLSDNSIPTTSKIVTTSPEGIGFNAVVGYREFLDWANGDGYRMNSITSSFLTAAPRNKDVGRDEYETLTLLQDYTSNISYIKVSAYTSSGSLIGAFDVTNAEFTSYTAGAFTDPENMKLEIGVGYKNLYEFNGTNPTTDGDCSYYTVQAFDGSDAAVSEVFLFTIVDRCTKYEPIRLAWLNPLGGWDYYTFKQVDRRLGIQKSSFKKVLAYNYSGVDRGETVYHAQSEEYMQLATDFVDSATSDWLSGLFASPEVFVVYPLADPLPVVVTESEYSFRVSGRDKLKRYELTLKHAHKINSNT